MLRTKFFLVIIVLIFCRLLSAQIETSKKPEVIKFAEYTTLTKSKMSETMHEFHDYFLKNGDSQLYVINYGTSTAIKQRLKLITQSIYWRDGPLSEGGMTFIYAPMNPSSRSKIRTVFWIVPPGADKPKP